jgi:F0F1-type ATP synthase epsilon subunit
MIFGNVFLAVRTFAAEATNASQLTLNFTTPHTPVHVKKTVDKVILPGIAGEYGVTAGHAPIISELRPGVVSVVHLGVRKY